MTCRVEQTEHCTLYLGDCLDVLPTLDEVDSVVTDPPYGIGVTRMTLGNRIVKMDHCSEWDDQSPDMSQFTAMGVPSIIWGGNYLSLPPSGKWLVWDKGTGANDFADCELAWTNLKGAIRKVFHSWVGANAKERCDSDRFHPTQKPVGVMQWCLGHLPEGCDLILDPFAGSGTTGVACIRTGRRFVGIEKEPKYFEIALKRIREAERMAKCDLFKEPTPAPKQLELV